MDAELKPCPFCGGKDIRSKEGSTYQWVSLYCSDCDASCGEVRGDKNIPVSDQIVLIEEWNRRDPAVARAAAEEMREKCAEMAERRGLHELGESIRALPCDDETR